MHSSDTPIKPGDWITVESHHCVVQAILAPGAPSGGTVRVVYNATKPTTRIVGWNGLQWYFVPGPDFGGYGRDSDPFVRQLKRGKGNL